MSLHDGLVAYYHPRTLRLPINGSAAAAFNPELTGCPNLDVGVFAGVSLKEFDGIPFLDLTSGSLTLPNITTGGPDDFSGPFTIACWARPTTTANWVALISRSDGGTPHRNYAAYLSQGSPTQVLVDCNDPAGSFFVTLSKPWGANVNNHVVVSCDGSAVRVWLNGGPACGGGSGIINGNTITAHAAPNSYTGWGQEKNFDFHPAYLGPGGIWRRGFNDADAAELFTLGGRFPFTRRMGQPLASGFGGSRIIVP